jgi:predicted DsbA family dithiol-disulfide isomerase
MLRGHDEVDKVRAELSLAQAAGVSGVPFFVLAGRFAVPGAQSREVMAALVTRARERLAEAGC